MHIECFMRIFKVWNAWEHTGVTLNIILHIFFYVNVSEIPEQTEVIT